MTTPAQPAAQEGQPKPTFDVASVKSSRSEQQGGPYFMPGGRMRATGMTLRTLIRIACSYQRDGVPFAHQILGGPDWLDSERFDVDAVAAGDPDAFGLLRLQALLEERFAIRLRPETRELPIYRLTVLQERARLAPAAGTCVEFSGAPPPPPAPGAVAIVSCGIRTGAGRATGRGVTASRIARWLSGQPEIGRMVREGTGLTGRYDFEIEWAPGGLTAAAPGPQASLPPLTGPGLAETLERELGLRLEPARDTVEVLVIDRAQRPTPN